MAFLSAGSCCGWLRTKIGEKSSSSSSLEASQHIGIMKKIAFSPLVACSLPLSGDAESNVLDNGDEDLKLSRASWIITVLIRGLS